MTTVRLAVDLGGRWPARGDTVNVPAARAGRLIAAGYAAAVSDVDADGGVADTSTTPKE